MSGQWYSLPSLPVFFLLPIVSSLIAYFLFTFLLTSFGVTSFTLVLMEWHGRLASLSDVFAYYISIFVFIGFVFSLYQFAYIYSERGTNACHPRSIAYRSPQIVWVWLGVNLSLMGASVLLSSIKIHPDSTWLAIHHGLVPLLIMAYPSLVLYYALRFGAMVKSSLLAWVLLLIAQLSLESYHWQGLLLGSLLASVLSWAVAFSVDMLWNHSLKKSDVVVPGDDETEPA